MQTQLDLLSHTNVNPWTNIVNTNHRKTCWNEIFLLSAAYHMGQILGVKWTRTGNVS